MTKPRFIKTATAIFVGLAFASGSALAVVPIKDISEIAGSWTLQSVSSAMNSFKTEENRTWEFTADGRLITSGYNRYLHTNDRMEFKFRVEGGKIVATDPGRPNKPQIYEIYEKSDSGMILQGGLEGFYFFKKK